jgi:hypothetical protein
MRFSTRSVAVAVLVIAILVPSVKKWLRTSLPVTEVDMTDKVIIVTGVFNVSRLTLLPHAVPILSRMLIGYKHSGASSGVGKETARILAGWGGRVIMACRDEKKATRVLLDIKNTTNSDQV